ncbi:YetF domain-containing protein [Hydrotalea sp.]|uniref:DUF421 domain-containing protein n=1 Tax=Hydrotalea sp. TaxID=2881279 RepID=UPI00260319F3|nr:YetF domain-containing protein [Hydrotalea sp.]
MKTCFKNLNNLKTLLHKNLSSHLLMLINLLPYLLIAAKSTAVYLFIIAAIRLFGKKELAQLSVIDLAFILLISNSVQNAMVGNNTTLQGGIAAASGLFISNYILKYLLKHSRGFSKMVQGEKILLIHDGVVIKEGLKQSMFSMDELERAIREHGVNKVEDVNLAILEVDGNINVLSKNYSQRTVKPRKKPQLSHNP